MRKRPRPTNVSKAYRAAVGQSNKDKHELSFLNHWKAMYPNWPAPIRDYRFHPVRRFAFDFAWPDAKVAVELHGGGGRGRHSSVKGQAADCEKMNLAQRAGWRVFAFNVIRLKDMAGIVAEMGEVLQ